jgi:S-adenosylmethionine-diacylglycerol 3-amino-3-carboxypropyl transferase
MGEITFTRSWEDDRLDVAALALRPGDRVLAVAAAGDVPLILAAAGAGEVVAVDQSVAQLRLTALKIAAADLDPPERWQWFEAGKVDEPDRRYRQVLRNRLAAADAAFWDSRIGWFGTGLHRQAAVERGFGRLGLVARLLVPGLADQIENTPSLEDQQRWWRRRAKPRLFGRLTHWLAAATPVLAPLAPNRHELDRMRRDGYSRALEERIDEVLGRTLVRRHRWWRPALSRRVADPGDGAAWLDADLAAAVVAGVGSIRLVHGDLASVLEAMPEGSLDAATVSNVPDWLDQPDGARLAAALVHAVRPSGRVMHRSVSPGGNLPAHVLLAPAPAADGGALAAADDRTALYGRVELLVRIPQPR